MVKNSSVLLLLLLLGCSSSPPEHPTESSSNHEPVTKQKAAQLLEPAKRLTEEDRQLMIESRLKQMPIKEELRGGVAR
jgi:hypothetical protein